MAKKSRIEFRCTENTKEFIKKVAKDKNVDVSTLIKKALFYYIEKEG